MSRLDTQTCSIDWIHEILQDIKFNLFPDYWKNYLKLLNENPIILPDENHNLPKSLPMNIIGKKSIIEKFVDNQDYLGLFSYFNSEINKTQNVMSLLELRTLTISYFPVLINF